MFVKLFVLKGGNIRVFMRRLNHFPFYVVSGVSIGAAGIMDDGFFFLSPACYTLNRL